MDLTTKTVRETRGTKFSNGSVCNKAMEPMIEANAGLPLLNKLNCWKGALATGKSEQRLLQLVARFHTFKHWISAWLACLSRAPPDSRVSRRERSPPFSLCSPFFLIKLACLVALCSEAGALSPVFYKGVFNEYYF